MEIHSPGIQTWIAEVPDAAGMWKEEWLLFGIFRNAFRTAVNYEDLMAQKKVLTK